MNVQLFNYHTAGAQVRSRLPFSNSSALQAEASGNTFRKIVCHSWNAGRCIALTPQCRFGHGCSNCSGYSPILPAVGEVSPFQFDLFATELRRHPDKAKVNFVLQGISQGFRLGFEQTGSFENQLGETKYLLINMRT